MQEEKKRILKMVEEGKLTVEEALLLLEQLEKPKSTAKPQKEKVYTEGSKGAQEEHSKQSYDAQAAQQKIHAAKEKFFGFVDFAVKKVKELDLDWNFGQSIDISHVYQQADVTIKDIDVDVANGSIKIVPWEQADVRVECEAKVYRVDSAEEAKSVFLKDVVFSVTGEKLRFGAQQKWMKVQATIYVPKNDFHHVRARLFNGPISFEQLSAETIKAKTANGKIQLEGVSAQKTELETVQGKVMVTRGRMASLEVETLNGGIELAGSYGNLDLQSFNGHIHADLYGEQPKVIMAKATTGSVVIELPSEWAVSAELKSNLGSFIVDLDDIQMLEQKNEVVQKHFAFKSIRPAEQYTTILAGTKTGPLTVKKKQEE